MSLTDLTDPEAVRRAMQEFDELERDAFLSKYGFGKAFRYYLVSDGRTYDAKAIIGAAHGFQYPDVGPLKSSDFASSESAVKGRLETLGFQVIAKDSEAPSSESIWMVRAGRDAVYASDFEDRGVIAIGFKPAGDVTGMDKEAIREALKNGAPDDTEARRRALVSQVDMFVNQMQVGDFVITPAPKRQLMIGRITSDYQHVAEPRIAKFANERAVEWLGKISRDLLPEQIRKGLGGLQTVYWLGKRSDKNHPNYHLFEVVDKMVREPSKVGGSAKKHSIPIELVAKWSATHGQDTVERHSEIAAAKGAVWWGVFAASDASRIGASALETFRAQLDSGTTTRVWLSGPAEVPVWRTVLRDIREDRPDEEELIPSYYPGGIKHKIWLKLSDFQETDRDWLLTNLEPAAQPGNLLSLGNQTNPLYVRERSTPRVWWVNQGSSYQRAFKGGYLWAPIKNKQGQELPHWTAMKYLRAGDVVLHYANSQIRAVGRVTGEAKPSSRPDQEADQAWNDEGRRAEVTSEEVVPPVRLMDIPQEWRRKEGRPFNSDGGVTQGYLYAVSDDFAQKLDNHFPQLKLREEVDLGTSDPVRPLATEAFDVAALKAAAVDRGLILEDQTYASLIAALESGKHVILTGPPGTAKTTLAEVVAGVASRAGRCDGHLLTTATADWTTYETIGGLKPHAQEGLSFAPGHFLEAIEKNQWLVIDELNRSNFDRAFGQLFTVLSGQAVELPYERATGKGRILLSPANATRDTTGLDVLQIPEGWRVVATMNVFDKSLLFEMSFALMRRFAFVEIPAPPDAVFHTLLDQEAVPDQAAAALAKKFLTLRRFKDLGPAMFMDLARFFRVRREIAVVSDEDLAFEGFYGFLLPQFEGIEMVTGEALFKEVRRLVGASNREKLRMTLNSVLGLELAGLGAPEEDDSDDDDLEPDASD